MDQHKLYRTIKALGEATFRTEEQLLGHVLENIIQNEQIPIRGGRIWKLDPSAGTYRLLRQYCEMAPIDKSFRIKVTDYPIFAQLPKKGTIVGRETNAYLKSRGIREFSATGVGEIQQYKGTPLYQYILAINADFVKRDMTYALNIIGNALTSALQNRKIESKAKLLEADIDKARDIQRSILPEHEFRFNDYELYGISVPDRVVGGDFFDYLQATGDKERVAVVVGDAASKGFSAAAQALYVSGALRMGVEFQTKMTTLFRRLNRLVNITFQAEQFVSMVYLELAYSEKGLVSYINAGHSNPILLRAGSGEMEKLPATGQILGPFPNEHHTSDFVLMNKGDVLLLYTDGITEATGEKGDMYGEVRLVRKLQECRGQTPKQICEKILDDVTVYSARAEYADDKTLVVIKRQR